MIFPCIEKKLSFMKIFIDVSVIRIFSSEGFMQKIFLFVWIY